MSGSPDDAESLRDSVRSRYGHLARGPPAASCGDAGANSRNACCTTSSARTGDDGSAEGYTAAELASVPEGSNLGLGCGSPSRLVPLSAGDVVLDLGSGAGIDCFVVSDKVGPTGRVIGVDMTPEMVARARGLAKDSGRTNVEFRLGEVEHLPVADASVDAVISNCVINLVPDKAQVYREAFRVLKPGGRLAVTDVLATRPIPEELRNDPERWSSCCSGALTREEVVERLSSAGFVSVEVTVRRESPLGESLAAPAELGVFPGEIRATKPVARSP